MEAKQIYKRSLSSLVTQAFTCKWSEDNRLSVVTEKGVIIFEIIPAPTQVTPILKLICTFIHPPEYTPAERYLNYIVPEIYEWKKEDVNSILRQDYLTPNFPGFKKMVPVITGVFWSPQKLFHSHKCLIALVTSAGAIELALQVEGDWISIWQLSSVWGPIVDEDLKDLKSNQRLDCESLKGCIYRSLATTATWSRIYNSDDTYFAYLVTAHKNSEIVIWKVPKVMSDNIGIDINIDVELKFKKKLISTNDNIKTLLWVHFDENNYLLIVGFSNGQIGALKLQKSEDKITGSSFTLSYADVDNATVDSLHVLKQMEKSVEVVAVKKLYLFIIDLDIHGNMTNMKFMSNRGSYITGVSIIDSNTILITSEDGICSKISTSQNQQELVKKVIKVDILKTHLQYLGLANSPNKLLFTIITSPSITYDHLIDRNPSNIYFLSLFNILPLNPLDILYTNEEQSLLNCWDCLEMVKINGLKYDNLSEILSKISVNIESLSLHKLRIMYWILTISTTVRQKNCNEEPSKYAEELEQCKSYIFLHSASNHLKCLAAQENLTEIQQLCIRLLRNHLEIWIAGEDEEAETPLYHSIRQILEATNDFVPIEEKCNLCSSIITEPWASSCPIGHRLPRCVLTSLQVTSVKYFSCVVCKQIYHPCLSEEIDEIKCIYCDIPVLCKDYTTSSLFRMSNKNLSRLRSQSNESNADLKKIDSLNTGS